jgi:hypothetical protein
MRLGSTLTRSSKLKKGGRPKADTEDLVVVALRTAEFACGLPALKQIAIATQKPRQTLYDTTKKSGKIVECAPVGGYQLSA